MRLLGLVWTKAPDTAIKAAVQDIVGRQSADGGWSQLTTLEPDAYATGLACMRCTKRASPSPTTSTGRAWRS